METMDSDLNTPGDVPPNAAALGRTGIVAIVGRANVGKSTLMNRLLDEKVSIVSLVPQTTRNLVRGILTEPRGQLVFLDTPGVHKATHDLGRLMNRTARISIEGADVALLVLDGSDRPEQEDDGWMRKLAKLHTQVVAVLNKRDVGTHQAAAYRRLWDEAAAAAVAPRDGEPPPEAPGRPDGVAGPPAPRWHEVSALTGAGTEALLADLFALVPLGPALFPEDMLTDFPRRWNIADVVREKLFLRLHDELPHAVAVLVDRVTEGRDRWVVDAEILVNRPTQKPIILGLKGRMLRAVRRAAEAELAAMYERPVDLNLWVRVEEDWAKKHWILKRLGYLAK
jgi:GTP-binding protein Era